MAVKTCLIIKESNRRREIIQTFDKQTAKHERKVLSAIRKMFKSQRGRAIEELNRKSYQGRMLKRLDEMTLAHLQEEWDDEIEDIMVPLWIDIVGASGLTALRQLSRVGIQVNPFDVTNPNVERWVGNKLDYIQDINQTTVDSLRSTLQEGATLGESIPDLKNRIMDVFDEADSWRATMIARTETISASNAGALEGYIQSGAIDGKEWIAASDDRTRVDHLEADAQKVGLEEPFIVGGERLQYPGDPKGSAWNTINCRCAVAPVIDIRY